MAIDLNKLDASVADPSNVSLSDADLAAKLSTLTKTPKQSKVTIVTLASPVTGWGKDRANQFWDWLLTAQSAGSKDARLALLTLGSSGIDPSDPDALSAAAEFVSAGGCTQVEVDKVFYDSSYPCGDVVASSDVATSRARVSLVATCNGQRDWLRDKFLTAMGQIDAAQVSGVAITKLALQATFNPNS